MQREADATAFKLMPIAAIEITFHGKPFREQKLMGSQLDMVVTDLLLTLPANADAVDQMPDRNQHAFRPDRVIGREQHVLCRQMRPEGAGTNAHRKDFFGLGMAPTVHPTFPDPNNLPLLPVCRKNAFSEI